VMREEPARRGSNSQEDSQGGSGFMNVKLFGDQTKTQKGTTFWVDLVEVSGFEPPASRVQGGRSPS
jgi:hypothetical protein